MLAFLYSSCARILKPKNFMSNYTGKYTCIDSIMNINGYYISVYIDKDSTPEYRGIMFYNNGIVLYPEGGITFDKESFEEQYVDKKSSKAKTFDARWGGFGTYQISKDTIIVQATLWNDRVTRMGTLNVKFLIKNKIKKSSSVYNCVPYKDRMDSANWLINKKWFWDKEAWKKRIKLFIKLERKILIIYLILAL